MSEWGKTSLNLSESFLTFVCKACQISAFISSSSGYNNNKLRVELLTCNFPLEIISVCWLLLFETCEEWLLLFWYDLTCDNPLPSILNDFKLNLQ